LNLDKVQILEKVQKVDIFFSLMCIPLLNAGRFPLVPILGIWWWYPNSTPISYQILTFVKTKLMKQYSDMNGLVVRGGRLMNERPNGMTGIQETSMNRKAMRDAHKAEVISQGIMKAERAKEVSSMIKAMFK
jgi:hypothetical protein